MHISQEKNADFRIFNTGRSMVYSRRQYLDRLIEKKDNGLIKIVTGLRRVGKSFLLFSLFKKHLIESGIGEDQIIEMSLDDIENVRYRNPFELNAFVKRCLVDGSKRYYVLLDEIQFVSEVANPYAPNDTVTFIDVLLGLMKIPNVDIYVTGSNSRMLSSDVLTQFRGRGDEVRVNPLSFSEVKEHYSGDERNLLQEYYTYGGLPWVWMLGSHEERSAYLGNQLTGTYLKDILERNRISNGSQVLESLLDVLASSIGSLTNPCRLSNTFDSERHIKVSSDTIDKYIGYFMDSFLIERAQRYDVKGRKYIRTPMKYYFTDTGLRNAKLGFRQVEETHLLENIVFNDLVRRGFDVDVGVVERNAVNGFGKNVREQLEVDFVVNKGSERCYIQSALTIADPEKRKQEIASLLRIPDSFRKIVVVKDYMESLFDENGIQYVGIEQFLSDERFI